MSFKHPPLWLLGSIGLVVAVLCVFALAAPEVVRQRRWLGVLIGIVLVSVFVLGTVWQFWPDEEATDPRGFEVQVTVSDETAATEESADDRG